MYLLIEANTRRGIRRFIIAGETGSEAEATMRNFLAEGERIMDESGEWFEAREIDESTIFANGVPIPPSAAVYGRFTNDGQRMV
jgi:hypothetical protein